MELNVGERLKAETVDPSEECSRRSRDIFSSQQSSNEGDSWVASHLLLGVRDPSALRSRLSDHRSRG